MPPAASPHLHAPPWGKENKGVHRCRAEKPKGCLYCSPKKKLARGSQLTVNFAWKTKLQNVAPIILQVSTASSE
ncbi:hypothetical protein NDU88_006409 [Pleurodeles waltl]|uniref:Uncharacterized protein n=1 Tax=Pleurodeles waltl TaxID=8319 RepID=A0AAV7LSH5_PLEWA|nr:hypothetical protein NDU88_006409 [Pleurodeles waltl]